MRIVGAANIAAATDTPAHSASDVRADCRKR